MQNIIRSFLLLLLILSAIGGIGVSQSNAFPPNAGGNNCSQCHSISTDEATQSLKRILPQAKVVNVKTAPIQGLWEVTFEGANNKRGLAYISFSKRHIIAGLMVDLENIQNLMRSHNEEALK